MAVKLWNAKDDLSRRGRLFRRADGIEESEELLDPSDLERIVDAFTYTHQSQAPPTVLTRDIRPD